MSPAPGPSFEHVVGIRVLAKQPFTYVDAEALRNIPCLERLDPARLQHQTRRKVMLGGNNMNVISDVGSLTCFQYRKDARSWSMNRRHVNELTAPSLVYMEGVQPVSCCPVVLPCSCAAWMLTLCVQGSKHALVDDKDMTRLIASHKSMRKLLGWTSDTEMADGQGMIRMPASILKGLPGCEHYPDSLYDGKYVRVMAAGQKDAIGNDIGGHIVASDAGRVLIFLDRQSASRWANNINQVNILIAPSITYIDSGHSQV
jgi:hypothetical protein